MFSQNMFVYLSFVFFVQDLFIVQINFFQAFSGISPKKKRGNAHNKGQINKHIL
jgi:hypothetical protein